MKLPFGVTVVVAALTFALSPLSFSQTSNASLSGTVEGPQQKVLPAAAVTAKNWDTGIVTATHTNSAGAYYFASLQPGYYEVRAQSESLQPRAYSNIYLGLSQEVRLNFALDVGPADQTIEISVLPGFAQGASSASVGSVLMSYSLEMLPTGGGNALDLVAAAPGTFGSNFAGGRANQVNTTRDGISVKDGRYDTGVYSQTYVSTDLINEVRVLIAPADAETGRGSGQVRMSTRSGTNQFHGTLFWSDRNSFLDANNWFNNFRNTNKNYLNRNQFGARLGGPIAKSKTFFFVLYEGMRTVQKEAVFADVLTAEARQGIFRYFPGVQGGGTRTPNPTVDSQGNPLRPANATGPLSSFNLFGRDVNGVFTPWDPYRRGIDPLMRRIFQTMPLPNDFTQHDGLNWAHYNWVRRRSGTDDIFGMGTDVNRDQLNLRIDHHFGSRHRFNISGTREHTWADNNMSNLPGGYNGQVVRRPQVYTASLVSTLTGSLVNEFRFGLRRGKTEDLQAYDVPGKAGEEARKYLGLSNGIPFIISAMTLVQGQWINDTGGSRANVVPLYTYADTLSWTRGKHGFKGGAEFRFGSNNAWNSDRIIPRVALGNGVPVTGITAAAIPGLTGNTLNFPVQFMNELAGSVLTIDQAFSLAPDPKNIVFQDYRDLPRKVRDIHQNEWSAFFKDDWKIRPDFTINLGLRYEYFGVPYESSGLMAAPVGGGGVIQNGSLSIVPEFVGKNSPQPDKQLYKDDWNNFAPAIGLSWSLPYFGKDKTVLRAGYGISYQGGGRGFTLDGTVGSFPGVNQFVTQRTGTTYIDASTLSLPIPGKAPAGQLPIVPLTARNDVITTWDPNLVTPYIQNFTVDLQRTLSRDMTMSVRYISTKGTKLFGFLEQNYGKIAETGLIEAMNITRAGGNAPLFDRMLMGLDLGLGRVDGTTVTGSASLRQNSSTRQVIGNGNLANLLSYLNTTANFTDESGGLLRNGRLAEDFFVKNPQFLNALLHSNPGSSTYHSMQLGVSKGLSRGFTTDWTYTWSRALGEADDDLIKFYTDPANRSRDKALLSFHRTHDLRSNATLELPFGPGRRLLSNTSPLLARVVEDWQLGIMFGLTSGAPVSILGFASPYGIPSPIYGNAPNFVDLVGDLPKGFGKVKKVANGVIYFDGLQLVNDPQRANLTSQQQLSNSSTLNALADAQGNIILQNPKPGTIGNLGRQWLEGPGRLGLDASLSKQVTVGEGKSFQIRVDALNVLNHPQFGNPVPGINNLNFGNINVASGNRMFTLSARMIF